MGLDTIDEPTLIEAGSSLDTISRQMREWTALSENLDRANALAKQRSKSVRKSQEAAKAARSALEAVESEWRRWLTTAA